LGSWLVLTFRNIHTDKSPKLWSVDVEAFRETVKAVDQLAEVVSFGVAVRT